MFKDFLGVEDDIAKNSSFLFILIVLQYKKEKINLQRLFWIGAENEKFAVQCRNYNSL